MTVNDLHLGNWIVILYHLNQSRKEPADPYVVLVPGWKAGTRFELQSHKKRSEVIRAIGIRNFFKLKKSILHRG